MFILKSFLTSLWMEKKRCRYIPFWFITLPRTFIEKSFQVLFTDDLPCNTRANLTFTTVQEYSLNKAWVTKKFQGNIIYSRRARQCSSMALWLFEMERIREGKILHYFLSGKRVYRDERICCVNGF